MKGRKKLFETNLAALKKRQLILGARLAEMADVHTQLLSSNVGDVVEYNIDLGHAKFYEQDAKSFADRQIDQYLLNPSRIYVGWIFNPDDSHTIAENIYEKCWSWAEKNNLTTAPEITNSSSGLSVVFGLGLGFHLDRLIRELDSRVFFVTEQYLEFLYHAMHVHDFNEWYEILEAKNGRLEFIIGDDAGQLVAIIHSSMKNNDFGIIDGCYFFMHYKSLLMKELRSRFLDSIPVMNLNPGFFDDECVMLRNSLENLTNPAVSIYRKQARVEKKSPAMIVGSGPSLDLCIDKLKQYRDGIVVFSCGTALGALLRNGIKPDYHIELENTPGPPKFVGDLAREFDISGVTLIGPTTIRRELVDIFDAALLFFRDSVTSTFLWGMYDEVTMAAPTVSNAGTRMAIGLGFREIYLVGVDLGARRKEEHHSKASIYIADETFLDENPGHKTASTFDIEQPGNLGGIVYTNISFLSSAGFLSQLLENFPSVKMTNLSDGLKIEGARPCLPEVLELSIDVDKTRHDLKLISAEVTKEKNSFRFDFETLVELKRLVKTDAELLVAAFENLPEGELSLFELYDTLNEIFKEAPTTNLDLVKTALFRGTSLLVFQMAFIVYRRLEERSGTGLSFIDFYRREATSSIKDMAAQAEEIMDELVVMGIPKTGN